ncbi:MAG: DNA polymerase Y family protein [Pseudomonadota bacterium]|nr:DNA polymerase Y family protein [Pseudomonadota bacterium]
MLWLALHFPDLPLDVFERARPSSDVDGLGPAPLAICDRLDILFADARARSTGVDPGMRRASALALLPDLRLIERDPARERAALDSLGGWALQFTPSVAFPEPPPAQAARSTMPAPAGLLLEIEPSLRLFGGLPALLARIRAGLELFGYRSAFAVAPTATGAWLLARHRDGIRIRTHESLRRQLDSLPISLLAAARAHLSTLESIGVHRLADLDALPRAGLGRRFGPALIEEVDRARGLLPEAHAWLQAPAEFSGRLELLARVTGTEPLLFAARRLLGELAAWLAARQAAVRGFILGLRHDDGSDTPIEIRLADPGREVDRLFGVLRERLAGFRLRAPVDVLELGCAEILPLPGDSASLLPSAASAQHGFGLLLERLQARLGRERVRRLHLVADHRPEAAWRTSMLERLPDAGPRSTPGPGVPGGVAEPGTLPRPLWLLPDPLRLRERNDQPWWGTPLALLAGPERIETGWWDQSLVQRDYFIAEDAHHVLYWIYRERTAPAGASPGWFMQGRFG